MMDSVLDKNLNNLNLFWQALNVDEEEGLFIHQTWPNKQWLADFSLPDRKTKKLLLTNKTFSTISSVEGDFSGMKVKSHLTVMSLALKENNGGDVLPASNAHNIIQLSNKDSAVTWAAACSLAFGYEIDANVIQNLLNNPDASVLAYMVDGDIAGTAISYKSSDTLGIHQLGTVPNFRKMGVAAALMDYLITSAQQDDIHYISLQASQSGLHLYEKMGFEKLTKITSLVVVE
jgi:ribosomal protein S18 acetylase RimI-like enzyme